jgi:hypothetical protein
MLLSQIISKDLKLYRKDDNRYEALCPWHKDTKPSLQIHNAKNIFKCFVCGSGGHGIIGYIMKSRKLSKIDALKLLETNYENINFENTNTEKEETKYLMPLSRFKKPSFEHYIYGLPTNVYDYRNLKGQLIGYTCRYSIENNSKVVLPYNYIELNGSPEWCFKGFKNPSLPYRTELLAIYPNKTVCIVEGEKACDIGNKNTNNLVFISWIGGSEAVNYADWSILKNRHVILIPDHDKEAKFENGNYKSKELRPGNLAMLNIASIIQRIASKIEFVIIPEEYSNKWDIADRTWKKGDLQYWINKHKQNYFKLKL